MVARREADLEGLAAVPSSAAVPIPDSEQHSAQARSRRVIATKTTKLKRPWLLSPTPCQHQVIWRSPLGVL